MSFVALDVLYVPSRDVAADVAFYRDILGARVVFAIEAMGTRVAEVALVREGPRVILAEHLVGDAPILLHRVSDLDQTLASSRRAGCDSMHKSSCRSARARRSAVSAGRASASTSSRDPTSTSTSPGPPTSADGATPAPTDDRCRTACGRE